MDIEMGKNAETRTEEFEHNMEGLHVAAAEGSVDSLATLLKADSLILDRVSLTSFSETPLHIAALRGHLEFTKALLQHKHDLAAVLDSQKCTALHLAAANGHSQVVKVLLEANSSACSIRDCEGRNPLHLAVMRGRTEALQELLSKTQINSYQQKLHGDSVLHLCVKYGQLEALKLLVNSLNDNELLNSRDSHGNTNLHLAVMLKQEEVVPEVSSCCLLPSFIFDIFLHCLIRKEKKYYFWTVQSM